MQSIVNELSGVSLATKCQGFNNDHLFKEKSEASIKLAEQSKIDEWLESKGNEACVTSTTFQHPTVDKIAVAYD